MFLLAGKEEGGMPSSPVTATAQQPAVSAGPLTGSQKRKARKHSISRLVASSGGLQSMIVTIITGRREDEEEVLSRGANSVHPPPICESIQRWANHSQ